MNNKGRLITGLKMILLAIWVMVGIASSAGCINFGVVEHEVLYIICGIINFGIAGFSIFSLYKFMFPKHEE